MKKHLSILSLGLILAGTGLGFSQEKVLWPCNTYEVMEAEFAKDPAARVRYEAAQKQIHQDYLQSFRNQSANKTAALEYTVPVVFHILHQGGPENISDATITAALIQINSDYERLGSDTNQIFTPFKSKYISSDIRFILAKKDPNGNCINGIVRHVDPKTNWDQTAAQSPSYHQYTWNPTKYLNVYVVANIIPQGTVTAGGYIGGYTHTPGQVPQGDARDCIIYRYNLLSGLSARSLSHEMGHWLGLNHTFGNTNNPGVICGDDGISDTPVTKGNFNACPISTTNTNIVCASNIVPYYQNVENFMDYSNCPRNFTQGQTTVMRNILAGTLMGRNNLSTASNLGPNFTDVNGLGICSPVAEFLSSTNIYTVCSGGSLTMKDFSYNGIITSYQWTADNTTMIASPTSSNTIMTFNTVGTTNVTLTVSNTQGSSTKVRTVTVINGVAAINGPYMESFEAPGLPANWMVNTTPSNGLDWAQTTNAGFDGVNSYFVDGSNTLGGQITNLQMPTINLLNNQGASFTFAYAYARSSTSHNDVFRLQFSRDCGGSWSDVVTMSSAIMAGGSGGVTPDPYYPAGPSEWKIIDVTTQNLWSSFVNAPSVWVRFSFQEDASGAGNNFFVDAINFTAPTGINELTAKIGLNMYPNPTTGATNVNFTLSDPANVSVNVVDLLGKEILAPLSYKLGTGEQTILVNKENALPRGIYFVNLTLNGTKMSKKLIIN